MRFSNYDFTDELAAGIGYVQSQQLGDGSFGYEGVPISYVTDLGALVLVRSESYPFSVSVEDAIGAMLAQQDVDGSWDQEPYDTALAVLALWDHNQPPTADAGDDQELSDTDGDGFVDVSLSGSGADVDGTIESYVWSEDSVEIGTGPSPTVPLAVGEHIILLTVTDDGGRPGHDTVGIVINEVFCLYNIDQVPECPELGCDPGVPCTGPGDFAFFVPCWLLCDGDEGWDENNCGAADFDCTGCVDPGDFAFFVTAWLKCCDDPSIVFPPCRSGVGQPL